MRWRACRRRRHDLRRRPCGRRLARRRQTAGDGRGRLWRGTKWSARLRILLRAVVGSAASALGRRCRPRNLQTALSRRRGCVLRVPHVGGNTVRGRRIALPCSRVALRSPAANACGLCRGEFGARSRSHIGARSARVMRGRKNVGGFSRRLHRVRRVVAEIDRDCSLHRTCLDWRRPLRRSIRNRRAVVLLLRNDLRALRRGCFVRAWLLLPRFTRHRAESRIGAPVAAQYCCNSVAHGRVDLSFGYGPQARLRRSPIDSRLRSLRRRTSVAFAHRLGIWVRHVGGHDRAVCAAIERQCGLAVATRTPPTADAPPVR